MLTVNDVLTSSGKYPERPKKWPVDAEMLASAGDLVVKVNALLTMFGESRAVTSGYRPPAVNAQVPNAAKKSNHMVCKAVDLADPKGDLDHFITDEMLRKVGLYREHPDDTPGWCHLQNVPPRSGNRTFRA